MKVLVTLLVVVVLFNACHGGTLTDKFKEIGDNLKKTGTAIKDEVTDITKVLGSVAKSKLKSLASQSLQGPHLTYRVCTFIERWLYNQ
ncbi:hypothetical protein EB796_016837 [Bugula neritina]|uniref:Uncharacterized protein n=1 Tax=Bugula neritina TaxID=10212 RepID=A0A7J7JF40_BUGNE|nr:hypothetical protein EB796_016837 [Bugula neritina]